MGYLFINFRKLISELGLIWFLQISPYGIHEYSNAHFANEERKFPSVERHIHVV